MHIDFNAPIVAGLTAAGFEIGGRYQDYEADFAKARVVEYYDGLNLVQEINRNTEVLRLDGFGKGEGPCIYFGPDTVRLVFTNSGILACIYVWEGYSGAYGQVKIGDPLATVSQTESLEYDSGDEMYYRVDANGQYIAGLAIEAMKVDASEHASTPINGFCVHDWSLFARNA
jgi:hypothetical protein